jgi:hypothetical protein
MFVDLCKQYIHGSLLDDFLHSERMLEVDLWIWCKMKTFHIQRNGRSEVGESSSFWSGRISDNFGIGLFFDVYVVLQFELWCEEGMYMEYVFVDFSWFEIDKEERQIFFRYFVMNISNLTYCEADFSNGDSNFI